MDTPPPTLPPPAVVTQDVSYQSVLDYEKKALGLGIPFLPPYPPLIIGGIQDSGFRECIIYMV